MTGWGLGGARARLDAFTFLQAFPTSIGNSWLLLSGRAGSGISPQPPAVECVGRLCRARLEMATWDLTLASAHWGRRKGLDPKRWPIHPFDGGLVPIKACMHFNYRPASCLRRSSTPASGDISGPGPSMRLHPLQSVCSGTIGQSRKQFLVPDCLPCVPFQRQMRLQMRFELSSGC